jgi:hypothetical protein
LQTIAAFLLERRDDMQWQEARSAAAEALKTTVVEWLKSKGGSPAPHGEFTPEDGSSGTFASQDAYDAARTWWHLALEEETDEGRRVTTGVSIVAASDRVIAYITVDAGWIVSRVMPVRVDVRCPRVVRDLLSLSGSWYHGTSILRPRLVLRGFDDGEALAAEIAHPARTVPVVVVSTYEDQPALQELDVKLAEDLAGLANVVRIDDEASWALTDQLGDVFACYWGAVRVYWPGFSVKDDRLLHPLWTRDRLGSPGEESWQTRERFRAQLRTIVFRAAALSVTRPREIDEIRDAAARRDIAEIRQRASSLEEYEVLADLYSKENDELRAERLGLRDELDTLKAQVVKLEGDRRALVGHLQASRNQTIEEETADIAPTVPGEEGVLPPASGDVRYYKKVYSRPSHDVMTRVGDCGCNNWEGAHAADKAKKGIAKLEGDRADWTIVQHCSSCTGGGMWRVRW